MLCVALQYILDISEKNCTCLEIIVCSYLQYINCKCMGGYVSVVHRNQILSANLADWIVEHVSLSMNVKSTHDGLYMAMEKYYVPFTIPLLIPKHVELRVMFFRVRTCNVKRMGKLGNSISPQ